MELLGVVGVILILAVLTLPSLRNMSEGSKSSVAERNAAALNSAVQQYDQLGGLMTAQVFAVSDRTDELKVLEFLRSEKNVNGSETGQLVASWQKPIFGTSGPRVIWVNGLTDTPDHQAVKAASGARNKAAEAAINNGNGGRFEVISDNNGLDGIVGFEKGEISGIGTLGTATPTPAGNYNITLNMSPAAAGTITLNGSVSNGGSVTRALGLNASAVVKVALNAGYKVKTWDAETSALLGGDLVLAGSFKVRGKLNGTLYAEKGGLSVNLSASPAEGGVVTGTGVYKVGDDVAYTAVP